MGEYLKDYDVRKIYRRWREGTGPFRCFFRATNFVSLKHYPDFPVSGVPVDQDPFYHKIDAIVLLCDPKTTLMIMDFPALEGIKTAYLLHKYRRIKTVLTFNSPLHPFGLVGGQDYIGYLLGYGELIEHIEPIGYAFLLDQNRFADYTAEDLHRSFNNQYELTDEDLPNLEMLTHLGFSRILYIYSGKEKEDINEYLKYLGEHEFAVTKQRL